MRALYNYYLRCIYTNTKMSSSKCKQCGCELDGDDILQALSNNELYSNYTIDELYEAARMFGWTPDNHKCFRRDISVQLPNNQQIEICPECAVVFPRDRTFPVRFWRT